MKYYILKELTHFFTKFKVIKHIKRVDNNILKIEFSRDDIFYFDMTKSNSSVFKKDENGNIKKDFNAPFDVILQKRFTNTKIEDVYLLNDDKILCFKVSSKSAYKMQTTILQLEFTGKNTNAIILDENNIILEALRHIDEWTSARVVKTGIKLVPLEKPDFEYEIKQVEDIEEYLYNVYRTKEENELKSVKKQKILQIDKNIKKLQKILNNLEDVEKLEKDSVKFNEKGSLILNELYKYNGYEKNRRIKESNDLFTKSKKAKQKAKNQYIEQLNLSQKLEFYQRLKGVIQECKTIGEVEFYIPKKDKNQTKTKKANPYQSFFCDGYKIMLGRDERENIYLLQNSKASDFWFHLQGQVSSHVIVSNTKKTLPEKIISEAAKICAKFSTQSGGVYRVDFTQRRNVKIQTRANVLYNPYSTIEVKDMTTTKNKGDYFEKKAVAFLKDRGFDLIETNYYAKKLGEIDIIVKKDDVYHFVEVKSGENFEAVYNITPAKLHKLIRSIDYYLKVKKLDTAYCIDAIVFSGEELEYLENITL